MHILSQLYITLACKMMEGRWSLILISIVVATFIKYAFKLLDLFWFKPKKLEMLLRKEGLNGNTYVPFLGDLKDFIRISKEEEVKSIHSSDDITSHIYGYDHGVISKHGQNSFLWFGPLPWLNITDPELIKEIFRRPDVFEKGFTGPMKILACGLASHEGEKWTKHKKIITPAFHIDKLKNKVAAIGLSCSHMIGKLKKKVSDSNEIDVWPYLEDLTDDVIARTAFGSNIEEGRTIFKLQKEKLELVYQLLPLFFIPGWRFLPLRATRKVKAISKEIECTLRDMIMKREKEIESGESIGRDDLLGILMESNKSFIEEEGNDNAGMSIEDVIEECQLFYLAGANATSSLLAWTILLLAMHPHWQTRAREEVLQHFGNSDFTFESLNRLKIVTMILQEVLRLYPPISLTVRRTNKLVKLGNMSVPAGIYMKLLLALPHYDPQIWGDDVKEFNPLRFSERASKASKDQPTFLPFGFGPRSCTGQNLVMLEAKIIIAMILQSFSFQPSPSYVHAPFGYMHLKPQYGAPLIFHSLSMS